MHEASERTARLLSYQEVRQMGFAACHRPALDEQAPGTMGRHREYVYEDDEVWLLIREGEQVHSVRIAFSDEIPSDGWAHRQTCDCEICRES